MIMTRMRREVDQSIPSMEALMNNIQEPRSLTRIREESVSQSRNAEIKGGLEQETNNKYGKIPNEDTKRLDEDD